MRDYTNTVVGLDVHKESVQNIPSRVSVPMASPTRANIRPPHEFLVWTRKRPHLRLSAKRPATAGARRGMLATANNRAQSKCGLEFPASTFGDAQSQWIRVDDILI